jgi:hypothetical protein
MIAASRLLKRSQFKEVAIAWRKVEQFDIGYACFGSCSLDTRAIDSIARQF